MNQQRPLNCLRTDRRQPPTISTGASAGFIAAALYLSSVLILSTLTAPAACAADIVTLSASPQAGELANARKTLNTGGVVYMTNASPADFSGYFNVVLPRSRNVAAAPLPSCLIGAHRQANGVLHTYTGPPVTPGQTDLSACVTDFQNWLVRDEAAHQKAPGLQTDPPGAAWTQLSVNTTSDKTSYGGNVLQETVAVYRANSSNTAIDYYMITKQVDSTPHFDSCGGLGLPCGWVISSRNLTIATDVPAQEGYALFDHGPLSVNGSTTSTYTVGANTGGFAVGVSGSFGMSWSQQDVTTDDNTSLADNVGSWHDGFTSSYGSDAHTPPPAVKGLWESDQAVIYTVPAGTTSFNIIITDTANFRYLTVFQPWYYVAANLNYELPVSPPALVVSAAGLEVFPGEQATFTVGSSIPYNTGENLPWTVSNTGGLNLNTTTGTGLQQISFTVPSTARPGLLTTLNIDSTVPYAAPQVRRGPMQFPITVVDISAVAPGVLLAGGTDWTGNPVQPGPKVAEVWNPATQKSSPVNSMTQGRVFHTATPIVGYRVFLAGGLDHYLTLSGTTEFYSEAAQSFAAGPNLQVPRAAHTATLLNDGTVLLVGGEDSNGNALASAELYDPVSNTTTSVGSMSVGRVKHTATLLTDGTVLIAGGAASFTDANGLTSAEIYNPRTKLFALTGSMSQGFQSHAATLLSNGQVLIYGGEAVGVGLLYTPASGSFSKFTDVGALVSLNPALVSLPSNRALLIQGAGYLNAVSVVWNPDANQFASGAPMQESRDRPEAVLLQNTNTALDGYVVAAGGVVVNTGNSGGTAIEAYNPQTNAWTPAGNMTTPRSGHTTTLFGIAPGASVTTLISSLNPSAGGQNVSFTAFVNAPGTPTGSITFYDGTVALGSVTLMGGKATLGTSAMTPGQHSITAVYSGAPGFVGSTSAALIQTVNSPLSTLVFSGLTPSQTIAPGTAGISLAGTLSGPGSLYPVAGGTVSINIGTVSESAALSATGAFSLTFPTADLGPGAYSISYGYAGDAKSNRAADTSTMLTVSRLTPVFSGLTGPQVISLGQTPLNLSGKIAAGNSIPTGSVSIAIGGMNISAAIGANGAFSASFDTHAILASGTPYVVSYTYAGSSGFNAAKDTTMTLRVLASSTTTVTSSLNPSPSGQLVTFTAITSGSGGTPAGSMTFLDGTTILGVVPTNGGKAVYSTSTLSVGAHSITALFANGDDSGFKTSTSPVLTQTVNGTLTAPVFSGLTPTQTIAVGTASISLSGVISAPGPIYPAAGEQVSVSIGGGTKLYTSIGLNGAFSFAGIPTAALAPSTLAIDYKYGGDAKLAAAENYETALFVDRLTPVFSNLTGPQVISLGQTPLTLSGKIAAGKSIPAGSVSITIGGVSGSAVIGANGAFSTAFDTHALPASGTPYVVTYSYAGGSYFYVAKDATMTLRVLADSTTAVGSSLNPSLSGQSVTFTAVVSGSGGTPGGSVTFLDGTNVLGVVTTSGGKAVFSTGTLSVGTHSITALFSNGDNSGFKTSTSPVLTQTVKGAVVTPTFSALTSSQTVPYGTASINLSGILSAPGPVYPVVGETVSISIGAVNATAKIGANGAFSASVSIAVLTAGPHPILYNYTGDSGLTGANNQNTTLTINSAGPVDSRIQLTVTPNPVQQGQTLTITAQVPTIGGVPATGNVTISEPIKPDGTGLNPPPIYGQGDLGPNGVIVFEVDTSTAATLTPGDHMLAATYAGDANYNPSSSAYFRLTVRAAGTANGSGN